MIPNIYWISILFFLLIAKNSYAQSIKNADILNSDNGKTLSETYKGLSSDTGINLIFQNEELLKQKISGIIVKKNILRYLEDSYPEIRIINISADTYIIVDRILEQELSTIDKGYNIFFIPENAQKFTAQLLDLEEKISVNDAIINNPQDQKGYKTDVNGSFSMSIPLKFQIAEVRHPGYKKQLFAVIRYKNEISENPQIKVESKPNYLDELIVKGKRADANIEDHRSGIQKLSIRTIKQIPTFLGEVDPIRSITTLPGVTSSGDLGAGYNVRGGETSQNLILQDGAQIFNPSHLFGFFSAFNPDLINNVELLKGCGPANYGGRVASVLNIDTRNGDLSRYKANGGIGLVSSRLTLEGPIVKGKASLLLSGRKSYTDWLIQKYDNIELKNSTANFSDLSGKLFAALGSKTTWTVTGYHSIDDFKFNNAALYGWETNNLSSTIDHQLSEKLFGKITFAKSNYKSNETSDDELFGYINKNTIDVLSGILNLEWSISDKYKILAGGNVNQYNILPGESNPFSELSQALTQKIELQKGRDMALFVESSLEINSNLAFDMGLRYAAFDRIGPGTILNVDYNIRDGRQAALLDSSFVSGNTSLAKYAGFEPRLSFRYKLSDRTAIKGSYNKSQQFIHQVSTTISPAPTDYWVLSSNLIKPQRNNQISLGLFHNTRENKFETSLEFFANKTQNAIDYLDGVDLKLNKYYELGLTQGIGKAYGAELFIKKNSGALNGWISYTYARSFRQFASEFTGQSINDGNIYPSVFDQPNQLSIVMNWNWSKRVVFSSNITYNSGRPITIPISKYSYDYQLSINNYSLRNQYRSPDYQRVDFSITFKGKKLADKFYTGDLIFSVYNLLARKNAYAIWFDNSGQAFKTAILGTIFPSLSYNFYLN